MEPVGDDFINHWQLYTSNHLLTRHGLLTGIVCVVIGLPTPFRLQTCLPCITIILLSWTVSVLLAQHKQFIRVNCMSYIAHTFIWLTVYVALPNSKRFIGANYTPYITHTHWYGCPFLLFCLIANSSNGLTMCPASHTQLKSEQCLMHPSSQMFCTFFDGFFTPPFAIMASPTVSSKGSLIVVLR